MFFYCFHVFMLLGWFCCQLTTFNFAHFVNVVS